MSRSTKKAIVKDVGHMKDVYWKVHRRTNKKIVKHFFESARHRVSKYDNWDDFFMYKKKFQEKGYSEEEAHLMAWYEVEDNEDPSLCSNCHIDWAEEPEVKYPKELINDYDYSDYRIDYEYNKRKGYYFVHYSDYLSEEWYGESQIQSRLYKRK